MSLHRLFAGIALWTLFCSRVLAGPAPAAPAEIPFSLEEGDIVVQAEFAPGKPLPFVFDSGLSDGNLVTVEAARTLGLQPKRGVHYRDSTGSRGAAQLTQVPRVRVGPVVLDDQLAAIASIPDTVTAREGKPPLAGFLGAPLMQDAVLCLDYGKQRLRRWARRDFTGEGLAKIPMPLRHGLPTIDVQIDGQRATLVVDTGSNGAITLFPASAVKAGGRAEADTVVFGDGSGFHHVPLSAGAQALDPTWGIDGLIGSAVLSQLEPCLDRDGQRILWRP